MDFCDEPPGANHSFNHDHESLISDVANFVLYCEEHTHCRVRPTLSPKHCHPCRICLPPKPSSPSFQVRLSSFWTTVSKSLFNSHPRSTPIRSPSPLETHLSAIPKELLENIILRMDIASALRFRQVSHQTRALVDAVAPWSDLATHASDALCVILRNGLGERITVGALFAALITSTCRVCRAAPGNFVWLPGVKRICLRCLSSKALPWSALSQPHMRELLIALFSREFERRFMRVLATTRGYYAMLVVLRLARSIPATGLPMVNSGPSVFGLRNLFSIKTRELQQARVLTRMTDCLRRLGDVETEGAYEIDGTRRTKQMLNAVTTLMKRTPTAACLPFLDHSAVLARVEKRGICDYALFVLQHPFAEVSNNRGVD